MEMHLVWEKIIL